MSRATELSAASPLAYAYTGGNAYAYTGGNAYAYTGGNAYAYSAPMESYGFGGYPGNPMLAAALQSTRAAIRRDILAGLLRGNSDFGATRDFGDPASRMPRVNAMAGLNRVGPQVRSSMALLELMSSVSFDFGSSAPDRASLYGRCLDQGQLIQAELVSMTRPGRPYLDDHLELVDRWSPVRDGRVPEIFTQVAPPIACFASVMNLQAGRHRSTLEFINTSVQFAYAVCMRFKLALNCPRPSELSAGLLPMLETPPHAALPAGHANEAHVTAAMLAALAGQAAGTSTHQVLRRLAHRIAENRVVAGLHFPVDNVAGRLLGDSLGSYLLAACGARTRWGGGEFLGNTLLTADAILPSHELNDQDSSADGRANGPGCTAFVEQRAAPALPVFRQMWLDAQAEWV